MEDILHMRVMGQDEAVKAMPEQSEEEEWSQRPQASDRFIYFPGAYGCG